MGALEKSNFNWWDLVLIKIKQSAVKVIVHQCHDSPPLSQSVAAKNSFSFIVVVPFKALSRVSTATFAVLSCADLKVGFRLATGKEVQGVGRRCSTRWRPKYPMLCNSASGSEVGLPDRISAGFQSGEPQNRPSGPFGRPECLF